MALVKCRVYFISPVCAQFRLCHHLTRLNLSRCGWLSRHTWPTSHAPQLFSFRFLISPLLSPVSQFLVLRTRTTIKVAVSCIRFLNLIAKTPEEIILRSVVLLDVSPNAAKFCFGIQSIRSWNYIDLLGGSREGGAPTQKSTSREIFSVVSSGLEINISLQQ